MTTIKSINLMSKQYQTNKRDVTSHPLQQQSNSSYSERKLIKMENAPSSEQRNEDDTSSDNELPP